MILRKLAISNFATHRIRFGLTVAAIALSVSLVVSVTSGYASMEAAVLKFLSATQGQTDVFLSHDTARNGVPGSIVETLKADPQVASVHPRLEGSSIVLNDKKKQVGFGQMEINGIVRPPDNVTMELGEWFQGDSGNVCVVDQVAARALRGVNPTDESQPLADLGTEVFLPGVNKTLKLKVVGVMRKPTFLAAFSQTIYVPLKTLQEFTGDTFVSRVEIDLKPGTDSGAFAARWEKQLAITDPLLHMRTQVDKRKEFDQNLQGVRIMSYLGGMVSMLAATFIVFSTLSMGVAERQRTLAMLRAIGATKLQVGLLVILEGLSICALGVAIGLPLGFGWLGLLLLKFGALFPAGLTISWSGVIFAAGVSLLAAMVASFLPAYSAMRTSPLEAMSPLASVSSTRAPIWTAIFGVFFASLDSLAMFGNWNQWLTRFGVEDPQTMARAVTFYGHFVAGLPGIMLGFFLLSPLFVWVVERTAGPIIARLFGLKFALLRQQLSTGIWRAAGTCSALMVGLAILVVMQTQGRTMMGGWQLPTQFPDVFITSGLKGLVPAEYAQLKHIEGIREIMPIANATPGYGTGYVGITAAAVVPDATMFFGVDPDLAFKMMKLDFREGTPEQAAQLLKLGRHVVVTEEFRQLKGLHIGDTLPLVTNSGKVQYTVAGVVWSPGIDVMVSMFDLNKQFEKRTAFSLFGTLDDAANDFGASKVSLFAANLDTGVEKKQLIDRMREKLGSWNLNIGDVRQIKHRIIETFNKLLLLASTVAFAAMAVSSLGVTNTIMASIRSRRWQFGVLRSIGVTRGALARLILAEGILLGAIGCALGLTAGLIMSINAKQLAVVVLGYNPPMVIPWLIIGIGTAIVFAVTLIASILPARGVANTEILELLQAGRAAA